MSLRLKSPMPYLSIPLSSMSISQLRSDALAIRFAAYCLFSLCTVFVIACEKKTTNHASTPAEHSQETVTHTELSINTRAIWSMGSKMLSQAVDHTEALNQAIDTLLATPENLVLIKAQNHWRELVTSYEPFSAFAHLSLVAPEKFSALIQLQDLVASWPIQPGYLDSYGPYPFSGLVFNVDIPISEDALRNANKMTDEHDVVLGAYALEFILFGEKRLRGPLAFAPITALNEKHIESGFKSIDELPRNRRRELLRLQSTLLLNDLRAMRSAWGNMTVGGLKAKFSKQPPKDQIHVILRAIHKTLQSQIVAISQLAEPALLSREDAAALRIEKHDKAQRLLYQLDGAKALLKTASYDETQKTAALSLLDSARMTIVSPINAGQNGSKTPELLRWQIAQKRLQNLTTQFGELLDPEKQIHPDKSTAAMATQAKKEAAESTSLP